MKELIDKWAAIDALSAIEVSKMEHCVGFVRSKVYHRSGVAYFKPYRNYYDAGGTDMRVWERLVEKGFADCAEPKKDGGKYYWLIWAMNDYIHSDKFAEWVRTGGTK